MFSNIILIISFALPCVIGQENHGYWTSDMNGDRPILMSEDPALFGITTTEATDYNYEDAAVTLPGEQEPQWLTRFKEYVISLAERGLDRRGIKQASRPTMQLLERVYKVKITDIDVNDYGEVSVEYNAETDRSTLRQETKQVLAIVNCTTYTTTTTTTTKTVMTDKYGLLILNNGIITTTRPPYYFVLLMTINQAFKPRIPLCKHPVINPPAQKP